MWTQSTITIAFRGALVFHEVVTRRCNSYYEIAVVPDPRHILRINTIKNCVLADIKLLKRDVNPRRPYWRLVVDNPLGAGISKYECGEFIRLDHEVERDFRWLNNFNEHFDNVERKVDFDRVLPILRIQHGVFYTLLKSPHLTKVVESTTFNYGSFAAVTGLDITILGGRVRLVEERTCREIFDFVSQPNTIYEFVNAPPDVEVEHDPHCPCGYHRYLEQHDPECPCPFHKIDVTSKATEVSVEDATTTVPPSCENDHFLSFYKLFRNPELEKKVCFRKTSGPPVPDPVLCSAVEVVLPRRG